MLPVVKMNVDASHHFSSCLNTLIYGLKNLLTFLSIVYGLKCFFPEWLHSHAHWMHPTVHLHFWSECSRFWSEVLETTHHHHHNQNTNWVNALWKMVHHFFCTNNAKVHRSYSSGSLWPTMRQIYLFLFKLGTHLYAKWLVWTPETSR